MYVRPAHLTEKAAQACSKSRHGSSSRSPAIQAANTGYRPVTSLWYRSVVQYDWFPFLLYSECHTEKFGTKAMR